MREDKRCSTCKLKVTSGRTFCAWRPSEPKPAWAIGYGRHPPHEIKDPEMEGVDCATWKKRLL